MRRRRRHHHDHRSGNEHTVRLNGRLPPAAHVGLLVKEGALAPDYEDEILKAALITKDGAIVHPNFAS